MRSGKHLLYFTHPSLIMSENASLSIFGGGTDQVFRDVNVRTAGRDMFTVIQNVSLNIPPVARDPVVAIKQLNIASSDNGAGHSRTTKKGRATLGTGSVWRGLYRTFSKGPTKGGTSKSAESKESGQVCEPGVSVSSAEEAEITSFLAGGRRTSAQIYVCNMLSVGEGLPCWNPKPFSPFIPEYGISPGDVGTICARDGFKKIFNLWEGQPGPQPLWMAPSSEDRLPPNPWFSVGDTFAKGASARASFASGYPSFEFNCSGSSEGSVLAITSDAYLETLKSVSGMRDFIMQNAAELYAYAVSRGDVESNNQPLYIITGCVKADTWAMAAFDESMEAPDDTLRLVTRYDDYRGMAQNFLWTDRGRADVRCSNGGGRGLKNQSLFLRGFKLTASESIWGRGQQKEFKGPSSFERKDDFSDGRGGGRDGNHEPSFRNEGGSAGHNFTSNPKPSSYPSGRQASLNAFPYGGQLEGIS
ncbi:hypothetical protein D9611_003874 [Ephemerocybe angulata]|uniref:Uncharacterized protein n=1 Tax=Ephemerocybe angulata TaxID=980116 RepID=A0A8H5B561_9AGAR|nr:hypothetical protein D9611_003874 [Tulosesus angulatus]